jgi:hypothetical protein
MFVVARHSAGIKEGREAFLSLSESRFYAEWPSGLLWAAHIQPFCGGTECDACAAQAVNKKAERLDGHPGENVTNAEEACASAQLYHQLLDEIAKRQLNANESETCPQGLTDETLARDLVTDW